MHKNAAKKIIFCSIPVETHNLSTLHTILSTGSPLKPASYDYVYSSIKEDVLLGSISGKFISCVYIYNKKNITSVRKILFCQ